MSEARETEVAAEDQVREELLRIRATVAGARGSLVATSDGLPVTHDTPDLDPGQVASLAAATRALAGGAVRSIGAGDFEEAIVKGSSGYFAVYAAGEATVVAVIGTAELNVGMLRYQLRTITDRIVACAPRFRRQAASADSLPAGQPLPTRRTR